MSVYLSVRKVYCGKTADWIPVPFEVVNGVGRGTDVLHRGSDRRRGTAVLGVNLERTIVINGDFAA